VNVAYLVGEKEGVYDEIKNKRMGSAER